MASLFSGVTITPTALTDILREEVERVVVRGGGKVSPTLTTQTSFVVSGQGATSKCVGARQNRIHVVKPEWIFESVRQGRALPVLPDDMTTVVSPMYGYTIAFTGIAPGDSRNELRALVEKAGGIYSGPTSIEVTHIVVGSNVPSDNLKIAFGKEHNIPCVHIPWLEAVATGFVVEYEASHILMHRGPEDNVKELEVAAKALVAKGKSGRMELEGNLRDQYEAFRTAAHNTAASDFPHLNAVVIDEERARYLQQAVVYICGVRPESDTLLKMRQICQGACGTVVPSLTPQVTHVLVGRLTPAQENSLREDCKRLLIPLDQVIVVDWVFDCYDAKSELPVVHYGYAFNDDAGLSPVAAASSEVVVPVPPQPADPVDPTRAPLPALVAQNVPAAAPPAAPQVVSALLKGFSMTLSRDFKHDYEGEMTDLIKAHSGSVVKSTDMVVTHFLIPHIHEALGDSLSTTNLSSPGVQCVTTTWLRACIELRNPLLDTAAVPWYTVALTRRAQSGGHDGSLHITKGPTKTSGGIFVKIEEKASPYPCVVLEDVVRALGGLVVGEEDLTTVSHIVTDNVLQGGRTQTTPKNTCLVNFDWILRSAQAGYFVREQSNEVAHLPPPPPPALHADVPEPNLDEAKVSKALSNLAERNKKNFMFSLISKEDRERDSPLTRDAIARMGGQCVDNIAAATHFVCSEPSQRESLLTALAKGIWLLHPSYIDDCMSHMSWVSENLYEWTREKVRPDAKSSTLHLASACCPWRERREKCGGGAFSNMKFFLVVSGTTADSYSRILTAGCATTVDIAPAGVLSHEMYRDYTHVLFDKESWRANSDVVMRLRGAEITTRFLLVDWITYHLQRLPDAQCVLWPKREEDLPNAKRKKKS